MEPFSGVNFIALVFPFNAGSRFPNGDDTDYGNDAEANSILTELTAGLRLSGFYSYGELGPQGMDQTSNFAHNESLILCAF